MSYFCRYASIIQWKTLTQIWSYVRLNPGIPVFQSLAKAKGDTAIPMGCVLSCTMKAEVRITGLISMKFQIDRWACQPGGTKGTSSCVLLYFVCVSSLPLAQDV